MGKELPSQTEMLPQEEEQQAPIDPLFDFDVLESHEKSCISRGEHTAAEPEQQLGDLSPIHTVFEPSLEVFSFMAAEPSAEHQTSSQQRPSIGEKRKREEEQEKQEDPEEHVQEEKQHQ